MASIGDANSQYDVWENFSRAITPNGTPSPHMTSDPTQQEQLDNLTGFGTGVMLMVNVPIIWIFGRQAMRAYNNYIAYLKTGRMGPGHSPPSLEDLISGRDVE
jgi:hypothetical protein